MPDVHLGKGCTVGSVIAMRGAVSPAAVGVDIGCGMGAVRTSLTEADLALIDLKALRASIEAAVPVGFNAHETDHPWGHRDSTLGREAQKLFGEFTSLDEKCQPLEGRARRQVGSLGGGNHFIEVCLDDGKCRTCEGTGLDWGNRPDDYCPTCDGKATVPRRVWLMLHSGSRNIGKELAEVHIERARKLAHNAELPDRDLAVFLAGTPEMAAYRRDLFWAQRYAFLNRRVMFSLVQDALREHAQCVAFDAPILCHHNYVAEETHFGEEVLVTRKGAIRAGAGELGVIPGSMGTASYIVEGLGNPESFCSASHGAGRRMSRGKAKRTFTVEDLAAQTAGIECRKDAGVLDEIPGAYKDIREVMLNQADLVRIRHELQQVLCVKG